MTDEQTMLTARRWTRYGKDRVYVMDQAGAIAGWLDLLTGATVVDDPALTLEVGRVTAEWLAQNPQVPSAPGSARPLELTLVSSQAGSRNTSGISRSVLR
jgi:hypothetical protein